MDEKSGWMIAEASSLLIRGDYAPFPAYCSTQLSKKISVISRKKSGFPFAVQVLKFSRVKQWRSCSSIGKASERI